mmetsp:Transcript_1073/g.2916  ORF Transcript_1073/g.2916 Transcript_1073/m.2916 type:complete len:343 (+) Transcript_1073:2241-3269(+)
MALGRRKVGDQGGKQGAGVEDRHRLPGGLPPRGEARGRAQEAGGASARARGPRGRPCRGRVGRAVPLVFQQRAPQLAAGRQPSGSQPWPGPVRNERRVPGPAVVAWVCTALSQGAALLRRRRREPPERPPRGGQVGRGVPRAARDPGRCGAQARRPVAAPAPHQVAEGPARAGGGRESAARARAGVAEPLAAGPDVRFLRRRGAGHPPRPRRGPEAAEAPSPREPRRLLGQGAEQGRERAAAAAQGFPDRALVWPEHARLAGGLQPAHEGPHGAVGGGQTALVGCALGRAPFPAGLPRHGEEPALAAALGHMCRLVLRAPVDTLLGPRGDLRATIAPGVGER